MDKNLQGSTSEFVGRVRERQEKDRKNRQSQGKNTPSEHLPNKQH